MRTSLRLRSTGQRSTLRIPTLPGNAHRMSVTTGCCGDMSPKEYPLRISLMRISSGQQMPLTAFRGRIWGTALQKNSLKHSLTLFAQPERLRKPQFWLNLTLQPKLWLRWNSFFYRWVSNLNLQFTLCFFCELQRKTSAFFPANRKRKQRLLVDGGKATGLCVRPSILLLNQLSHYHKTKACPVGISPGNGE